MSKLKSQSDAYSDIPFNGYTIGRPPRSTRGRGGDAAIDNLLIRSSSQVVILRMPEGPEIKRAADAIALVLKGRIIVSADLHHDALKGSHRHIVGQSVNSIESQGKALLTHFSSGKTLYSHNQLYGLWRVVPRGSLVKTNRMLRIGLHTKEHSALLYSATDISLWDTEGIDQHPFLQRLGPDLFTASTRPSTILERLQNPEFKNRRLASLYLDQGFIAGIGNYLRSEILFFAGIHPLSKPGELSTQAKEKLARNTLSISQRSYRTGGITLPPRLIQKSTKKSGRNYERDRFAVFARSNKPCRSCGVLVQKTILASRRMYWCPQCQPE